MRRERIQRTAALLSFLLILVFVGYTMAGPAQDEEGFYLLSSGKDFAWFADAVRKGETRINARLVNDIYIDDDANTGSGKAEEAGDISGMIPEYGGCFDAGGYGIIGNTPHKRPVFGVITESGCVRNLKIRTSRFESLYENRDPGVREDETFSVPLAAALCGVNYGIIENCTVEADILGDGEAGGVAGYNYGTIADCVFRGRLEGGRCLLRKEEALDLDCPLWRAGGIAAVNYKGGVIRNCASFGDTVLHADGLKIWRDSSGYPNDIRMESCAGGIVGKNNALVERCRNEGNVSCARVAGGIAGASSGIIAGCENTGDILLLAEHAEVTRLRFYENEERVAAGISGYNTGRIQDCAHSGRAVMESDKDRAGYVFGIAQSASSYFCKEGETHNCYYLAGKTAQKYRQSGVYKLSEQQMENVEEYLYGAKAFADVEDFGTLYSSMEVPGTDEADYIRLFTQPQDAGDAEPELGTGPSVRYLLRALDERDFGIVEADTREGRGQAPSFAKKNEAGWLYVYYGAQTAGEKGLSVMVESKEESDTWLLADAEPAIFSSCIFYSVSKNEEGDLFSEDFEKAKENIRKSARAYLGDDCTDLQFYRYGLENGENLFGFTFRCSGWMPGIEEKQLVDCAVFYRMREGLLAEFTGVEAAREDSGLFEAVRYLAASVDQKIMVTEDPVCDSSEYLGRHDWEYETLHNPFALVRKGEWRVEIK